MRKILCLIVIWANIAACESSPLSLSSRMSVELPVTGGSFEDVYFWASQDGEELSPEKISDTVYRFDLEPNVTTKLGALIFETTRVSGFILDPGSSVPRTEEFIDRWIVWEGDTDEFTPPPGSSSEPLNFPESETKNIQFEPIMKDSAGVPHPWEGSWLGVELKDIDRDYTLSKFLAQSASVPAAREIQFRAKHPVGPELDFQTINTRVWPTGTPTTIDLGNPPLPLPFQEEHEIVSNEQLVTLNYSEIYAVNGYSLECALPTSQSTRIDNGLCEEASEWIPCTNFGLPGTPWDVLLVHVRYKELPTLGCSELQVTRSTNVLSPNVTVRLIADSDNQYLEQTPDGWVTELKFTVTTNGDPIMPLGIPTLQALAEEPGDSNDIPGLVCEWNSLATSNSLEVHCGASQVTEQSFYKSVAVLNVEYRLEGSPVAVQKERRFRVMGVDDDFPGLLITAVIPAYRNRASSHAQMARAWVQITHDGNFDAATETEVLLSLVGTARVGEASVTAEATHLFSMKWPANSQERPKKWVALDFTRVALNDDVLDLSGEVSLELNVRSSEGDFEQVDDNLEFTWVFADRPAAFLREDLNQTLRFSAEWDQYSYSKTFQMPVRGLGVNRGGYLFEHQMSGDPIQVSTEAKEDAQISLNASPGTYSLSVGSFFDFQNLASGTTDDLVLDTIDVELVRPTQPASLVLNNLRIGNQWLDVNTSSLGELQRLLWDPYAQSLVVVGENGFELFRLLDFNDEGFTGLAWASIGTIIHAQLGGPCSAKIADAVIRSYREGPFQNLAADAGGTRRTRLDFLTEPTSSGEVSSPARHCWIDLDGLDTAEAVANVSASTNIIGSFGLSTLNEDDCIPSFNSAEMVLSYNGLNDTFWALSRDCLVGYRTRNILGESVPDLKTTTYASVGAEPKSLTIDPHSGVAIARYWSENTGFLFKRIILEGEPSFEPSAGQAYANRDAMIYDPVRNWNWEVVNLVDNTGSEPQKNYYLLPSVEPSQYLPFDGAPFFQNEVYQDLGFGMNHVVLDSSRGLFHSLRVDTNGTSAQLTQELHQISDAGEIDVTTQQAASWVHEFQLESDVVYAPVVDIVLVGPQITGSLPQAIRPGDYVTLLGQNFSGDISRDKVCIQGICVAPQWSTTTTLSFQVPQVFQSLDVPLRAHVTVDNGTLMSGPAPGVSMLERRDELWREPDWSQEYSVACSAAYPCFAGTIYQGVDGLHLSLETEVGEVTGYKLQGGVAHWSPGLVEAGLLVGAPLVGGNPSLTPSGRNTNIVFGQRPGFANAIMEARIRANMVVQSNLPAQNILSNYIAASSELSRNQSMWYTEQYLSPWSQPEKLLMSANQSIVGLQVSLQSSDGGFGISLSGRHIAEFTEFDSSLDVNEGTLEPLPGRGGFMVADRSGTVSLALKNRQGGSLVDYAISEICGWPNAQKFQVVGTTGATAVVGMAVLDTSPLRVGVASITQGGGLNGSFQKDCKIAEYNTGLTNNEDKLQFKVSADGRFFVIGFGNEASYFLKVWRSGGLTPLVSKTTAGVPLDIEFSDSGNELYVLYADQFKVMSLNTSPLGD